MVYFNGLQVFGLKKKSLSLNPYRFKHMPIMKKLLFPLLFIFPLMVNAQEDMKKTLGEYLRLAEAKDSEKIMDYMYPGFFTLYPRHLMVEVMNRSFNDPAFEILLMDSRILDISPLKTVDTVTYAVADYSVVMTLKYLESDDNPLPDAEAIELTQGIFKQMYGEENVRYIPEETKFRITAAKKMLVLKTPGLTAWKVLGVEENLKPVMKKIIPEKILEDL